MVAAAALIAWLYLAIGHGRFWRLRGLLPPRSTRTSGQVVAVIPARDEAATIGATVRSLLQYGNVATVIVADDNSTDGTAAIASDAGARIVQAGPLPPGWTGKLWALRAGVEAALQYQPEFLLLTDADIVYSAGSVAGLTALSDGRDLVSVMVRLNCSSRAERLLIPAFVFFFFMLYPPSWIRRRDRRAAGAAGGCILLRPEALERIGGLESIRSELIDDCALARQVKRSGGSVWLGISDDIRSVRPYRHFADVRDMIARTAYTQLRYSPVLLASTIAGMTVLYVLPVVAALGGNVVGALTWLLMTSLYLPLVRFYRQPLWSALLLPAAGIFYTAATLESARRYRRGRGGEWKGRHQAAHN